MAKQKRKNTHNQDNPDFEEGSGSGVGAYGIGYADGSGYGGGKQPILNQIHLQGLGPAENFDVTFGNRITLFTGDNGLGKSFLLDLAWSVLSHTWAKQPPLPRPEGKEAWIEYVREGMRNKFSFNFQNQEWEHTELDGVFKGQPYLVLYLQADGSMSLWDAARNRLPDDKKSSLLPAYHFTQQTLWNGLEHNEKVLCNGLIQDWVRWQFSPTLSPSSPFQILSRVLQHLSPHYAEQMIPAQPMRTSLEDVRDIPTLELPYGIVPITHASAGMQRILSFAYLLTWAWSEHLQASQKRYQPPASSLVLLIDEPEAHLHPQWQRLFLPALLTIASSLETEIDMQIIATTHSPLILASLEPYFQTERDRLYLFSLLENGKVKLAELPWSAQGDTVAWLTSEVFGLEQARSIEGEEAIAAAEAYMLGNTRYLSKGLQTEEEIHQALLRAVPGHDPFWPRWVVKTKQVNS